MAKMYINAMTALWNSIGTTYSAIKMNVSDGGSHADSKLIQLQVATVDRFYVKKNGDIMTTGTVTSAGMSSAGSSLPATADGGALGSSALPWSDVFLASGGVINWNAGDVTITHSSNLLTFAGASSGYSFDAPIMLPSGGILNFNAGDVTVTHAANALAFAGASNGYSFDALIKPATDDGAPLGSASFRWSDLFMALGAVINIAGDWIATHTAGILTVGTGDLRVTTAGTNTASVVTVGGTQTLLNKTLTTPAFSGTPTGAAATTAAQGFVVLATGAEAITGTDTAKAVTPAALDAALDARVNTEWLSGLFSYRMDVYASERIVLYMPYAGSVTNVIHKMGAGAVTFSLNISGVNITGLTSIASSTTRVTTAASGANTFAVGAYLEFTFAGAVSTDQDFSFIVTVQRTA